MAMYYLAGNPHVYTKVLKGSSPWISLVLSTILLESSVLLSHFAKIPQPVIIINNKTLLLKSLYSHPCIFILFYFLIILFFLILSFNIKLFLKLYFIIILYFFNWFIYQSHRFNFVISWF
jgi:hypothetical protein